MKVTAKANRSGGWWAIEVPEVPGVFTQARRLDQVAEMVADAVATMLDVPANSVEVDVQPELDGQHRRMANAARASSEAAALAQLEASKASRLAVTHLRADGLTTRDVATILGLSHQRVAQLERS